MDESSLVRKAVQGGGKIVLHDIAPGEIFQAGEVQVTAFAARHPVPAVRYRMEQSGKVFCYTGDTNTVEGLADFAEGADFLLADGLFTNDTWAEGKPHLAASLVAQLAKNAEVRRFAITHLNPAIDPETLLREARAIRTDALMAKAGDSYDI